MKEDIARKVSMIELTAPLAQHGDAYKRLVCEVIDSRAYVGGPGNPYILELERSLHDALGGGVYVCACNSGTTALIVALLAAGVSPGDEVILPDFNFIAGVEAVVLLGARPVFVDVDEETYLIDFDAVEAAINHKTAAVVVTDLFGQFPNYAKLAERLSGSNVMIIEDGAQSFGASDARRGYACTFGHIATTSFYPVKPLGAFGEGGAVFSRDPGLIDRARIIINHGSREKYQHIGLGFNGRLNAIQAVTVNYKLTHYFGAELAARQRIATRYLWVLPDELCPKVLISHPSWAQFTIIVPERDKFRAYMQSKLISTDVHYPRLTSKQGIYGTGNERNSTSQFLADNVVSIPIHPYLSDDDADYVIAHTMKYLRGR